MSKARMVIIVTLAMTFMLGAWCADVSITCLNVQDCSLTNGMFTPDPVVSYHMGMFVMITAFFFSLLFIIDGMNLNNKVLRSRITKE